MDECPERSDPDRPLTLMSVVPEVTQREDGVWCCRYEFYDVEAEGDTREEAVEAALSLTRAKDADPVFQQRLIEHLSTGGAGTGQISRDERDMLAGYARESTNIADRQAADGHGAGEA